MKSLLLDTGALVALLDRSDGAHGSCVEALRSVSGRMLTTEPVVTESLWLLDHSLAAQQACIELLLATYQEEVQQCVIQQLGVGA